MQFSILMSAYNVRPYVRAAVESALAQDHGDFELIVIDDGSTDGTLDCLAGIDDPRLRLETQENTGKATAMNRMIGMARGTYLVVQDADDLVPANRLSTLGRAFETEPDLVGVMSGHALLIGDRVVAPRGVSKSPAQCRAEVMAFRQPAHDPTLAWRRDFALENPFSTELRLMQGVDMVFRIAERHPMRALPDALYHYRIHPNSTTGRVRAERPAYMRAVFNAALARRGEPEMTEAEFEARFGQMARDPSNNLIGHFTDAAYLQTMAGDRQGALSTALAAMRHARGGPETVKPLIYALSPRPLARRLRGRTRRDLEDMGDR